MLVQFLFLVLLSLSRSILSCTCFVNCQIETIFIRFIKQWLLKLLSGKNVHRKTNKPEPDLGRNG